MKAHSQCIFLLLADPSPCLRWLVLQELLDLPPDHPEVKELEALREEDPLVSNLLEAQEADGSWTPGALAAGWGAGSNLTATALALARLGYLGFGPEHKAVADGANFLFAQQQTDGSWPLHYVSEAGDITDEDAPRAEARGKGEAAGYSMIPLQTAFPLRGLAACGYALDPRAERAYEWLLAQRLSDGAWPTGLAGGGVYGFVGGYRRLPHSRWGCRSNTTGALICLVLHPQRCGSPEAQRALFIY